MRARLIAALALAAVLLAGCALGTRSAEQPARHPVMYEHPLEARVYEHNGTFDAIQFYVNQPAHVAVFEIVPGRGMGLVFPRLYNPTGSVDAGWNMTWYGLASWPWTYVPAPFAAGWAAWAGPERYLLLVASEEPLRISQFQSPTALRAAFGISEFRAWDPYDAMERLMAAVVPAQPRADWAVDVYAVWPELSRPPVTRIAGLGLELEDVLDDHAKEDAAEEPDTPELKPQTPHPPKIPVDGPEITTEEALERVREALGFDADAKLPEPRVYTVPRAGFPGIERGGWDIPARPFDFPRPPTDWRVPASDFDRPDIPEFDRPDIPDMDRPEVPDVDTEPVANDGGR